MANYVTNVIEIKGKRAAKLIKACQGKNIFGNDVEFTFNSLVPLDQPTRQRAIELWGTSQDAWIEDCCAGIVNGKIGLVFDTPYTPPVLSGWKLLLGNILI